MLVEAQRFEVQEVLRAGQQAHHHALAVRYGQGGEAHVVVAAGDLEADAAILRQALLGDVQVSHDLDARHDARLDRLGQRLDRLVEHVVDAEAHAELALEGLDVDVAGALLHGVVQQRIHQLDDGGVVVRGVDEVLRLVAELAGQGVQVAGRVLGQRVRRARPAVVDFVDRAQDGALIDQLELQLGAPEQQAQIVQRRGLQRIRDGDADAAVPLALERQAPVLLGEGDGHALDERLVHVVGGDLGADRQAELHAQGLHHLVRRDVAPLDEMVRDPHAVLGVLAPRLLQLLLREVRGAQQQLAEVRATHLRALGVRLGFAHHGAGSSSGSLRITAGERSWDRATASPMPLA